MITALAYQKTGVEVLRRAWVNPEGLWAGVLAIKGVVAIGLGFWPVESP